MAVSLPFSVETVCCSQQLKQTPLYHSRHDRRPHQGTGRAGNARKYAWVSGRRKQTPTVPAARGEAGTAHVSQRPQSAVTSEYTLWQEAGAATRRHCTPPSPVPLGLRLQPSSPPAPPPPRHHYHHPLSPSQSDANSAPTQCHQRDVKVRTLAAQQPQPALWLGIPSTQGDELVGNARPEGARPPQLPPRPRHLSIRRVHGSNDA